MLAGLLLVRELRGRGRWYSTYVWRALHVLLLGGALAAAALAQRPTLLSGDVGARIFGGFGALLAALAGLFALFSGAGSLAADRAGGVLELLFCGGLGSRSLIRAKAWAVFVPAALLVAGAAPFLFTLVGLGGVSPGQAASLAAHSLSLAWLGTALGVLGGAAAREAKGAYYWAAGAAAAWFLLLPLTLNLAGGILGLVLEPAGDCYWLRELTFTILSPLPGLQELLAPGSFPASAGCPPWMLNAAVNLAAGAFALRRAARLLPRRLAQPPRDPNWRYSRWLPPRRSRRRRASLAPVDSSAAPGRWRREPVYRRPAWRRLPEGNPVAWREELAAPASRHRSRLRLVFISLAGHLAAGVLLFFLLYGNWGWEMLGEILPTAGAVGLVVCAPLAWLLPVAAAAQAFAAEREPAGELLLTTALGSSGIVRGKLAGLLGGHRWLFALTGMFWLLFLPGGSPLATFLAGALAAAAGALVLSLALLFSLLFRHAAGALAAAFAVAAAVQAGVCFPYLISPSQDGRGIVLLAVFLADLLGALACYQLAVLLLPGRLGRRGER